MPRPLKVTFETKEQQQKLLANLINLKEADEDLKILSISPDLTKEARAEIKIKVEEAKELTKNSKDSVFKDRGNSGHLRLVGEKTTTKNNQAANTGATQQHPQIHDSYTGNPLALKPHRTTQTNITLQQITCLYTNADQLQNKRDELDHKITQLKPYSSNHTS